MNVRILKYVVILLLALGVGLYSYLEMQNEITALQIEIPKLALKVEKMEEENVRLKYHADIFASPENLLKIAQRKEFSHLTYPSHRHIVVVKDLSSKSANLAQDTLADHAKTASTVTFAAGIKP